MGDINLTCYKNALGIWRVNTQTKRETANCCQQIFINGAVMERLSYLQNEEGQQKTMLCNIFGSLSKQK